VQHLRRRLQLGKPERAALERKLVAAQADSDLTR
jgi:hypothetical protein